MAPPPTWGRRPGRLHPSAERSWKEAEPWSDRKAVTAISRQIESSPKDGCPVLAKGLMRVRHYGLLANRCRVQRLAQIREILAAPAPKPDPKSGDAGEHEPGWPCPVCRQGRMRPVREIPPRPAALGCAPYR